MSVKKYKEFVSQLEKRFRELTADGFAYHPGPNYMTIEDTGIHGTKRGYFSIVWADAKGTPQGSIDLIWLRNPVPCALGGVFETRVYVDPKHRGNGIGKKLYKQAIAFAKALSRKALMQGGKEHACMLVEDLIIPDTGEYARVRSSLKSTLSEFGYSSTKEKPDYYSLMLSN